MTWVNPFLRTDKASLIKNTVCKDLLPHEFDLFAEVCEQKQLNPLLGQIFCKVLVEGKERKMIPLVGIMGQRAMANRTKTFMQDESKARFGKGLADQKGAYSRNPIGLISIRVYMKKMDVNGVWHRFSAVAHWDEYAPLIEVEKRDPDTGELYGTGVFYLDKTSFWYTKPYFMLEKCAEALALRKGWPDDFVGIWEPAEFDKSFQTAYQFALRGDYEKRRRDELGVFHIPVRWYAEDDDQIVPIGQFADRLKEFIAKHIDDPQAIVDMRDRNRFAFDEFFNHDNSAYLDFRDQISTMRDKLIGRTSFRDRTGLSRHASTLHGHV